jgi:hypothetical protein
LNAKATDADGSIVKIEIYDGSGVLRGVTDGDTLDLALSDLDAGVYTFYAKATDDGGASSISDRISVEIGVNHPPSVSITAPASESEFTAPATIAIAATIDDADGNDVSVEFFDGTAKIGAAAGAPYGFLWADVAPGTYKLHARATDSRGASTDSSEIVIRVQTPAPAPPPPTVASITIGRPDQNKPVVVRTTLDHPAHVEATVYNRRGVELNKIFDADESPGVADLRWDGRDGSGHLVDGGVYVVIVRVDGAVRQREKVVILRD